MNRWVFGKEAKRLAVVGEDCTETDLYGKAKRREKVSLAGKTYDAVWLLAKYISLTLQDFENNSVSDIYNLPGDGSWIWRKMLKGIGNILA